ncbi:MAG: hypothetical protein AB1918_09510 [Pseudomonadota bacterium]
MSIIKKWRAVVIACTCAALAACASNVELQRDGTGTDEQLPSPCAGCMPIPYEAPTFNWGVG